MAKSVKKFILPVLALLIAMSCAMVGSLAYFTDSASIHAGIKTNKLTGSVTETTMVGTPDSDETWLESTTAVKDGGKVLFSALTTDYKDGLATKDSIKTFNVSRGNALSVTGDSALKTNQTFKVKFTNSNAADEIFYPEIRLTALDGKSLAQYEKVLGVADASAKATLDKTVKYQNVVNGTSEDLLTANIYTIPSLVNKAKVNADGSLSLYLDGVTVKAGETVECSYSLTENLNGHLDYTVPQVYVTTNATIRYPSAVNSLWYGTATAPSTTSGVIYSLAPDYQTRVLWRDVTGKYTVRGGHDAITVSDKDAAATTEALDYTVATYQYTGADQTPAAYLLGSKVNTKLYKAVDGKWTAVNAAVERGSYKAVVDTSDVEGFAISHTEFYFNITKAMSNVDFDNKPGSDGQPDPDNKLVWNINDATKVYDGKQVSIQATDKQGNVLTDFTYTNKETGETSTVAPKNVGVYIVRVNADENHEYPNTATITITKATLQVVPTITKSSLLPSEKPGFGYTVSGFAEGDNELDISGKDVKYIVDGKEVPSFGQTYTIGSHDLTLTGLTAKNYDFNYAVTVFAVGKGTTTVDFENKPGTDGKEDPDNNLIWVSADSATKVYDAKPLSVRAKDSNGNVVDVEYYTSDGKTKLDAAPKNAGTYIAKAVESADYTYSNTATIEITKAQLTVTASTDKEFYLPSEIPVCSYTVTGFVADEDESDIDADGLMYRADLVNQFKKNYMTFSIGKHTLDVEGLVSKSGNYSFTYKQVTFEVAKKDSDAKYDNKPGTVGTPLTWNLNGATKVYDGKEVAIIATLPDGTVCPSITYIKSDGTTMSSAPKDVGTYTAIPSSGDYNITNPATIIITPAPLTATAKTDANAYVPSSKPTLGYVLRGFVNGETDTVVDGTGVKYAVDGKDAEASGVSYEIGTHTVSVSGLAASNYTIRYVDTTFSVAKKSVDVSFDNKRGSDDDSLTWTMNNARKVYDGKPVYVVAKTDAGKEIAVEYFESDGITKLTSEPVKAGTYIAKPVDDADNEYVGTATIVIEKAPLEITLKTVKDSYEATETPEFTYSASGFVNGETEDVLTGTIQYEVYNGSGSTVSPDENGQYAVGTYFIRANGFTAENYTIQYKIGQLVVEKPLATGAKFGVTQYQMRVNDDLNTDTAQVFNCTPFYQYVAQPTVEFQNDTSKAVVFIPTITLSYADGSPVGVDEYYYCDGMSYANGEYTNAEKVTVQYYTNRFSSKEYSFVDTPVLQSKMKSAAIDNGDGTVSFTAGEYTVANNRSTSVRLGSLIKDAYSFTDEEKTLVISVKCTARFEDDTITAPIEISDSANNRAQTTEAKIGTKINFGVAWRKSTARSDWRLLWDQDASAVTFPANSDGSPVTGPIIYYTDDDSTVYTYDGKNFGDLMAKTYYKQIGDSWQQINADEVTNAGVYKIVASFADDYAKFNDMFNLTPLTHNEVQFTVTE